MLATYFVDTTDDTALGICAPDNPELNSDCSIRSAIEAAETNPGADTIEIPAGTYPLNPNLGSLDIFVAEDLSFIGDTDDPGSVVIDGTSQSRVLDILATGPAYSVQLEGLTIQNGVADDGSGGGGINAASDAHLILSSVVVQNNTAEEFISEGSEAPIPSSGGGVQTSGNLTITDSVIRGNTATEDGGGIDFGSGSEAKTLSITNTTILGNSAASDGGGVATDSSDTAISTVTLDNVVIEQNGAGDDGGGLALDGGTTTINGGRIDGNSAGSDGGGIDAEGSLTVIDTTFDQNQAGRFGGAIRYEANTDSDFFSISAATLTSNSAGVDGGAVHADGDGEQDVTGTVVDTTFDGNTAEDSGGGAFFVDMAVEVTSSTFRSNEAGSEPEADGVGGGLYVRSDATSGDYLVTDSTFQQNEARGGGGGAFFVDADGDSSGNLFDRNEVTGTSTRFGSGGGGFAIVGESRTVTGSVTGTSITDNLAPAAGGLAVADADVTVTTSDITGNQTTQANSGGGGIGVVNNMNPSGDITLRVDSSTVSGNATDGRGGGIGAANANLEITDTRVENNQATGGLAGGVGIAGNIFELGVFPTATIRRSTLAGNTSSDSGGGLGVINAGFVLENVTITGNAADNSGGGIAYDNSNDSVPRSIRFSTIASNSAPESGSNIAVQGNSVDVLSSLFADGNSAGPPGAFTSFGGNLDQSDTMGLNAPSDLVGVDPLLAPLADNGGPVPTRALNGGSPAIDAVASDSFPATDARGITRPQDGDGDASALADIGAYEAETLAPSSLEVTDVTVDEADGTATVTVTLNGTVPGGFTVDAALLGLGGAVAGEDYVDTSPTLTFEGTDEETQTFDVTIIDDPVVEPSQQIEVALQDASAASVDDSDTGQITINDNDVATLAIGDTIVSESDGSATVTVAVDLAVEGGFSVVVMTGDSDASSGEDYVSTTQTLEFTGTAGETQSLVIALIDDQVPEPDETIDVEFAPEGVPQPNDPLISSSAIIADDVGQVTILDDDAPLQGHVSCDEDGDGIEDPGEQVIGTQVFLDTNGNGRLDPDERSTLTDESGNYQFDDVTETSVSVVASAPSLCIAPEPPIKRSTIGVGDLARSITHADIDGDQDLDLLIASDLSNSLAILENNGGEFTLGQEISLGDRPQSVFAWRSSEQQGLPQIAVAGIGTASGEGKIYHLQGGALTNTTAAGNGPVDVVLDDFDGDGLADTLAAAFRSSDLNLHLGSESAPETIATGRLVRSVATGDFNGDGRADIVFAGAGYEDDPEGEIQVLLGDGTGEFSEPIGVNEVRDLVAVRGHDLDGDGTDEVLGLSKRGQLLSYTFDSGGTSAGSLTLLNRTEVAKGASSFAVGDFNRDEQTDVAVANLGRQQVELLIGDGSGRFFPFTTVEKVSAPSDLTVADFDGDQIDDIAVSNLYTDTSIGQGDGEPRFRLPSTTTILKVSGAEKSVVVSDQAVTQVDFAFSSADPRHLLDVNGDRAVTALDALSVINHLNRSPQAEGEWAGTFAELRTDTNGDGKTTALDALLVINALNRQDVSAAEPSAVSPRPDDDEETDQAAFAAAVDLLFARESDRLLSELSVLEER